MRRRKNSVSSPSPDGTAGKCMVEAIVNIDERGQMVMPKDLREKIGLSPGDKFVLTSWEKNGRVCCITLTRVEELSEMVRGTLAPVLGDLL